MSIKLHETEHYSIIHISDEKHWHKERSKGLGGSDAGIICGLSKYKTPFELWEEKTGLKQPKFQTSEAIDLGNRLEPVLFEMFKQSFISDYETIDTKDISLVSKSMPYMRANLDGALIDKSTRQYGILEIKTTTIRSKTMIENWKNQIPDTYYCQILHYLKVTGFKFAVLYAWINYPYFGKAELKVYKFHVDDEQVRDDMQYLIEQESKFWEKVLTKQAPDFINIEIN